MQNLPAELIVRIFVECWPAGQIIRPDNRSVPLQLMGVCRQWREIALCTPLLWSSLDTTATQSDLDLFCMPSQGHCKEWLSKSGNFPISLKVAFKKHQTEFWMNEWMHFVCSYGSRFARLQVVDELGMDLDTLFACSSKTLKYFSLQNLSNTHTKLAINQYLPSLKTLLLDLVVVDHSTLRYQHCGSLTHLAFRLPDQQICPVDKIFDVLSYCSSLQVLVCGRVTHDIEEDVGVLGLPRLQSLTLIVDEELEHDQPIFILERSLLERQPVDLPNLNCLRVQSNFPLDLDGALCEASTGDMAAAERQCKVVMSSHLAFRVFDAGWKNLSRLEVNFEGGIYMLNTALLLCRNLHTLTLTGHHCDTRSTSLLAELNHSHLTELFLSVDSEIGDFFQTVTLPCLRVLCIATLHCGRRGDILEMLDRSACMLDRIQLKEGYSIAGWTNGTWRRLVKLLGSSTIIDVDLVEEGEVEVMVKEMQVGEEEEGEGEGECTDNEDDGDVVRYGLW